MMHRTITRLFNSHSEAMSAVEALEDAGVPADDISMIASNADNWHDGQQQGRARKGDRDGHGDNDTAEDAGKGAATGGLIGGAAGLLAGLGMLAIPGLGPVVAAGWLASTAVGALAGAAAGGAAGGIIGALKDAGHTDEEANVYAEGVRRGGTLVSVRTDDSRSAAVERILQAGVDARDRGAAYRSQGWRGFDPNAPAFSAEEAARERTRYAGGESRTFADQEGYAPETDDIERGAARSPGVGAPQPRP
jgi:hypothetical protein